MCQSNVVNAAVSTPMTHIQEDQLMDENTDEIIANKTKRSRDLTINEGHIETSPHSTEAIIPPVMSASNNQNPISTKESIPAQMEPSQKNNYFLSAEPGSQACRGQ